MSLHKFKNIKVDYTENWPYATVTWDEHSVASATMQEWVHPCKIKIRIRDLLDGNFKADAPGRREYGIPTEVALKAVAMAHRQPIPTKPQHDAGAMIYLREAVMTLREQRDKHGDKNNQYDPLVLAAWNTRDLFEWLYPMLWVNDVEFVPFDKRGPHNNWGKKR